MLRTPKNVKLKTLPYGSVLKKTPLIKAVGPNDKYAIKPCFIAMMCEERDSKKYT